LPDIRLPPPSQAADIACIEQLKGSLYMFKTRRASIAILAAVMAATCLIAPGFAQSVTPSPRH